MFVMPAGGRKCTLSQKEKKTKDITRSEENKILNRIIKANEISMYTIKSIPRTLCQWWSKAVTVTLHEWLKARTTKEALCAIERWSKLKSTVIKPLREREKMRRRREFLKLWQRNLERWINGDWKNVWKEACDVELRRKGVKKNRSGRNSERKIV